jgi:hypothetical protein
MHGISLNQNTKARRIIAWLLEPMPAGRSVGVFTSRRKNTSIHNLRYNKHIIQYCVLFLNIKKDLE